jgi:hypothetical protein
MFEPRASTMLPNHLLVKTLLRKLLLSSQAAKENYTWMNWGRILVVHKLCGRWDEDDTRNGQTTGTPGVPDFEWQFPLICNAACCEAASKQSRSWSCCLAKPSGPCQWVVPKPTHTL